MRKQINALCEQVQLRDMSKHSPTQSGGHIWQRIVFALQFVGSAASHTAQQPLQTIQNEHNYTVIKSDKWHLALVKKVLRIFSIILREDKENRLLFLFYLIFLAL